MKDLAAQQCQPQRGLEHRLTDTQIAELMPRLPDWQLLPDEPMISRVVLTNGFDKGLELVNQVGQVAEAQDHHPDILLTWPRVEIRLCTHDVGGLSMNDFILAAKIEFLINSLDITY